jgi:UPF0755 protein
VLKKIFKIFLLSIFAIGVWFYFSYDTAINKTLDSKAGIKVFSVKEGQFVGQISRSLKEQSFIGSDVFFRFYASRSGLDKKFQVGAYELSASLSAKEIAVKLASGNIIDEEREVTVIEGWTRRDLAKKFKEWGLGEENDFYFLAGEPMKECQKKSPELKDYSSRFDFLADKPECRGLEGYLFPDTYRLYKNASAGDLVDKMLRNFNSKLTSEMREDIKKQGKTIYEIATMASVVEKEVRSDEDMKIVAGIFWNRLASGQGLESCATLAYILGVNKAIYSLEDTQIESLYNTYKYQGLPPGPISNPGFKAIWAAIYPTKTDFNYFLSRPDTGETVFSKTYQEHLNNKNKYLK